MPEFTEDEQYVTLGDAKRLALLVYQQKGWTVDTDSIRQLGPDTMVGWATTQGHKFAIIMGKDGKFVRVGFAEAVGLLTFIEQAEEL